MNWKKVSTTNEHEHYELWNNSHKLLALDLHPFTNSARLQYANEKRVFLIRKEGFLRNRTVLCNEYGVRLGQHVHDNKEDFIELNDQKFYYDIRNTPVPEMLIYSESKATTLIACGLDTSNGTTSFTKDAHLHASLLLALSWYMLLPTSKEALKEYA
jgi:hypothetical protein